MRFGFIEAEIREKGQVGVAEHWVLIPRLTGIAKFVGRSFGKSSLYDLDGKCLSECFETYPTYYPKSGWHEQRPEDWWRAVVTSTRRLLSESGQMASLLPVELQQHSWPAPSVLWKLFEYGHAFLRLGPCTGCI